MGVRVKSMFNQNYLSLQRVITRVGFLMCIYEITLFRIIFSFLLHFKRMLHVFYIDNQYPALDWLQQTRTRASSSSFQPV